ncbi:MAG: hypothetical protein M1833_001306, partial [Piccolia ochrophora]
DLSEREAERKARRLQLLPLSTTPEEDASTNDTLADFLIHRARRIDAETGLETLLPELIVPFIDTSEDVKGWFISTLLPLSRLNYELYPESGRNLTLAEFEGLEGNSGVDTLLSYAKQGDDETLEDSIHVARDLKNVVGPWIWGSNRNKRRKLGELPKKASNRDWSTVYAWLVSEATTKFLPVAQALEHWNGPGDVDLGGYDGTSLSSHASDEQRRQYAGSALQAIYNISETSADAIITTNRILSCIASRIGLDPPPDLPSSVTQLASVDSDVQRLAESARTDIPSNHAFAADTALTTPTPQSLSFLHAVLLSSFLVHDVGQDVNVRQLAELCLYGDEATQTLALHKTLHTIPNGRKRDKQSLRQIRERLLWLHSWGTLTSGDYRDDSIASCGLYCRVRISIIETEFLRTLLYNSEYRLAVELYSPLRKTRPLDTTIVEETVLDSAMHFYDNATNGNKNRGGMKKAEDIIKAFYPAELPESASLKRATKLLDATHALSFYSLKLQRGIPFQPVNIRVAQDPVNLLNKVLEQNPKSYTKLDDLISIGQNFAQAGLLDQNHDEATHSSGQLSKIENRIKVMAIEAALAEDDFETAYSYVMNRLSPLYAEGSQPVNGRTTVDDFSWRAAFQAGRYRSGSTTTKHPNAASPTANPEIRRLEMRMELLSQALLLSPSAALSEVLGVWRRCEEEMNVLYAQETEAEDDWDDRGDRKIPGQFINSVTTMGRKGDSRGGGEEAPMGLFDVARGAAFALKKTAFPFGGRVARGRTPGAETHATEEDGFGTEEERVRKRDMVSNMVTGGLASGIGWVLGAAPVPEGQSRE